METGKKAEDLTPKHPRNAEKIDAKQQVFAVVDWRKLRIKPGCIHSFAEGPVSKKQSREATGENRMRAPVLTSLVLLFTAVAAIAQDPGASVDVAMNQEGNERGAFTGIYGAVVDPAEGEIAYAPIRIIDEKGNMQTAYADAKGQFKVMLEPGTCRVEVTVQGFQTASQKVEVRNGLQQLNFVLKLGTCCSGPEVTAAPQVEPAPAVTEMNSLNSGNVVPENPQDKTKTVNAPGIHGTVIDPTGAIVFQAPIVATDKRGLTHTAYIGTDGMYRLALPPGAYKVEVTVRGFQTETQNIQIGKGAQELNFRLQVAPYTERWSPAAPPLLETEPADTSTGSMHSVVSQDVQKATQPGIYGTVTDQVGAILVQGPVVATDDRGKRYTARVDLNGMYGLDLPPGKYKVEVAARGFQTATQNIQIGKGTQELNFQLQFSLHQEVWSGPAAPPPIEIEPVDTSTSSLQSVVPEDVQKAIKSGVYGMVVDPTGAVIPRTHVVAIDQHGESHDTCSNSEGIFQMKLKRGNYQVSASAQGFRTVTQSLKVNDAVHDLNFRLTVESGSSIEVAGEPMKAEPVRADPCPK